jgi:hypothetical protein
MHCGHPINSNNHRQCRCDVCASKSFALVCQNSSCGKTFYVDSRKLDRLYCSVLCANEDPKHKIKISEARKQNWRDKSYRDRMMKTRTGLEYRQNMSESCARNWKDPEFRSKMMEIYDNPEHKKKLEKSPDHRKKLSDAKKLNWQDPEYVSKMTRIFKSVEHHEVRSKSATQTWQDSEFRAKRDELAKNPEYRRRLSEGKILLWQNLEFKALRSDILKQKWKDSDYRLKMTNVFISVMNDLRSKGILKTTRYQRLLYDLLVESGLRVDLEVSISVPQVLQQKYQERFSFLLGRDVPRIFYVDIGDKKSKLAIEVDGGVHLKPDAIVYDDLRTSILEELGWSVIRFFNSEVSKNIEEVRDSIIKRFNGVTG